MKVRYLSHSSASRFLSTYALQMFCLEAVTWQRLKYSNILPFLGATRDPQLVPVRMPGGSLTEYVYEHPQKDRLTLVTWILSYCIGSRPHPFVSCSPTAAGPSAVLRQAVGDSTASSGPGTSHVVGGFRGVECLARSPRAAFQWDLGIISPRQFCMSPDRVREDDVDTIWVYAHEDKCDAGVLFVVSIGITLVPIQLSILVKNSGQTQITVTQNV